MLDLLNAVKPVLKKYENGVAKAKVDEDTPLAKLKESHQTLTVSCAL